MYIHIHIHTYMHTHAHARNNTKHTESLPEREKTSQTYNLTQRQFERENNRLKRKISITTINKHKTIRDSHNIYATKTTFNFNFFLFFFFWKFVVCTTSFQSQNTPVPRLNSYISLLKLWFSDCCEWFIVSQMFIYETIKIHKWLIIRHLSEYCNKCDI